ncbi:putative uncharacterized protein DDB_G0282133 isoform X2 [Adelges cooleyi]|uniref:putative uncharacterized protein DDB_G0282133 isoform X2 n=1 Tax=Adelges cooleyi TaxID=133065 RepID=UPI00217F674A|nr:putative uncharacterized protein DDB_G0282133 isoform X2 [Adelges cooleyi]
MLRFCLIFFVCLATYTTVNADNNVLGDGGKPFMPSGLQDTQNMVGKNKVVGDFKTNDSLGNIQLTTARGLGTTTNWYENSSATDNFQTYPQQNNRANNSNRMQNRRNRRRNNNRRYSQSYGSPSYDNSEWKNYWDNFQPVVASPPASPSPSPFSSDWQPYWDNFQPVMTQQMPSPPSPPSPPQMNRMNYNNNFPFNRFNNYGNNNGNINGNGRNSSKRQKTQFNQFNDDGVLGNNYKVPTNSGTQGATITMNDKNELIVICPEHTVNWRNNCYPADVDGSGKLPINLNNHQNIQFNDDGALVDGHKVPTNSGTQGASVNFNDKNELIINGQKIPPEAFSSGKTPDDWVIHGSNFGNVNSGNVNEDNTPAEPQYRCILYKGMNNVRNNCYFDGSPNISLYDGGVVINGKKIPMDVGNTVNPSVQFNEKDGFTINGKKVPADAEGNPLKPADVDAGDFVANKNNIGNLNSNNENSFNAFNNTQNSKSRKDGQQKSRRKATAI